MLTARSIRAKHKEVKMRYPALIVEKAKLTHNTKIITERAAQYGIEVTAVTKCYCAIPELAEAQVKGGVKMLADSRVENLKKMAGIAVPKMLIRIPMISQADEVVRYADISMNSEIGVIRALSEAAVRQEKIHRIILMIDIGDLREGCWPEDAMGIADEALKLKGVLLCGVGANFSCFGGIMPERKNLNMIVDTAKQLEAKHGVQMTILSGGNSVTYDTMINGQVPKEINHFRLGETILLGIDSGAGKLVEGAYQDAFTLKAEIIELKDKPSKPIGRVGIDAFGNVPEFEDIGIRKRAICAIGRQDLRVENVTPRLKGAQILGASSDHMIIDVTDCGEPLKVGDVMSFDMAYGGLLSAATSEYVTKYMI